MNMVKDRFRFIRNVGGWLGEVKFYEDTRDGSHILVSRADTFDRGDETMIFPAYSNGSVKSWVEIGVGYGVTHEELLALQH